MKFVIPTIIIVGILGLVIFYNLKNKENIKDLADVSGLSFEEAEFLTKQGFVTGKAKEEGLFLKNFNLTEQKLDSEDEYFAVLATKIDVKDNNYKLAFKLENKSEQEKEFYLIPVFEKDQMEFKDIKIEKGKALLEEKRNSNLADLYDVEKHKQELNPELARAYDDIENNNYQAKPIKLKLAPKTSILAQSQWNLKNTGPTGADSLEPVYFLVYGSAGGVKEDLVILNIHSSPQQGENWVVYFTTRGVADLKIIPNDQATIKDDEFVLLGCNIDHNKKRTPQILQGDIIYYPNWDCPGVSRVVHLTKKAGKHTLRIEFNNTTDFAYNDSQLAKKEPGEFSFNQYNGLPEIASQRTYNTKVFDNYLNEVGTKRYSIHTAQIHYKNGNGFENIDTKLSFSEGKWRTDKASYHPTIPEYADQWFEFYNGYEGANHTIKAKPEADHVKGEYFEDKEEGVYVLYRNAFGEGIDLKVFAEPAGLKKVIVLNIKPGDISKDLNFDFELELPAGAKVVKEDNSEWDFFQSLDFKDKRLKIGNNNKFSYFNPALVWDSNDDLGKKINEKVEIKLFRQGNKTYLRKTITKDILAKAVYPLMTDHPTNYYAGAGDGYVSNSQGTWDATHNGTDGTAANPSDQSFYVGSSWNYRFEFYAIWRAFIPINTDAITGEIESAALYLKNYSVTNNDDDGSAWLNVVQTSQPDPTTVTTADFDLCGATHSPTYGATAINLSSVSVGAYNSWILNATGISWINQDGYTLLGMREGHDGADYDPNSGSNAIFWGSEATGTSDDPYLDVTVVPPPTYPFKVKAGLRVKGGLRIFAP